MRTHARPAFTDVVGELLAWDDGRLHIRRRDGSTAEVDYADVVAARVIPPPPMRYPQ